MITQRVRDHCLTKPGAWLDEPWEGDLVAKVADKIFAFLGDTTVGLKCGRDADDGAELRARYPDDVTISAYIGRYGWNTLRLDGAIAAEEIFEAVDRSYDAVVAGLPKSKRP